MTDLEKLFNEILLQLKEESKKYKRLKICLSLYISLLKLYFIYNLYNTFFIFYSQFDSISGALCFLLAFNFLSVYFTGASHLNNKIQNRY